MVFTAIQQNDCFYLYDTTYLAESDAFCPHSNSTLPRADNQTHKTGDTYEFCKCIILG